MPPARTIIVDVDRMLAAVAEVAAEQQAAALSQLVGTMHAEERRPEAIEESQWVARDLARLAGRLLTASERIRHQQAVRQMAADGLIELRPRWVRLTDKGRAQVEGKAKADA